MVIVVVIVVAKEVVVVTVHSSYGLSTTFQVYMDFMPKPDSICLTGPVLGFFLCDGDRGRRL